MKENEMKPKRVPRHRGAANLPGRAVNTGDKTTPSQPRTSHVSSSARIKPLAGRLFYLDLPSNRAAEALERDIKELGGTVEKFFSKEIKYLVSNKREARYVQCLRQDSPVPSPESGPSSPHPRSNPHPASSHGDNVKSRSQGQTETIVASRGKSLVERVVKEQERVHINKILSNALEWGVKILYIDDVLSYIQKRKKTIGTQRPAASAAKTNVKPVSTPRQGFQKYRGGRICKPFIKVEDSSRHYRPIVLTMSNVPEFNLKSAPPYSPFNVDAKVQPGNKQEKTRGAKASASEERARKKNKDKKQSGYCECCAVKYENLTTHLWSERHKAFSKSNEYSVVDRQVSSLRCNFIHINAKVKRSKCSVSSPLLAPGPCGKTELRHKGDLGIPDTIQEEQPQIVESHEGHVPKTGLAPGSAHLSHGEGERTDRHSVSDRSQSRYFARKLACRQNSLSPNPPKTRNPHLEKETAPPCGERLDSVPHVHSHDQTSPRSPSRPQLIGELCYPTNQHEESRTNTERLKFEAAQDPFIIPDKMTQHNSAGNTDEKQTSQSSRSTTKLQRKAGVYKRKRRKCDARVEHAKKNNTPDQSLRLLWQIFQSSDDMDVEFHGFEY